MKTLITVLGAEHSALIPFHICTKETAEKNKTKKKKRTQSSETALCRREEVYAIQKVVDSEPAVKVWPESESAAVFRGRL